MTEPLPRIQHDALAVLQDLLHWELPATRWAEVGKALDALDTGLELTDLAMLTAATITLEQAGPVRFNRIGEGTRREPAPPAVLERTGELITRLTGARDGGA